VYIRRQRFAGYSPPAHQQTPGGGGVDGGQSASPAGCGPSTYTRADSTFAAGGVSRPTVRFSQPVLSTINELTCSQVIIFIILDQS